MREIPIIAQNRFTAREAIWQKACTTEEEGGNLESGEETVSKCLCRCCAFYVFWRWETVLFISTISIIVYLNPTPAVFANALSIMQLVRRRISELGVTHLQYLIPRRGLRPPNIVHYDDFISAKSTWILSYPPSSRVVTLFMLLQSANPPCYCSSQSAPNKLSIIEFEGLKLYPPCQHYAPQN